MIFGPNLRQFSVCWRFAPPPSVWEQSRLDSGDQSFQTVAILHEILAHWFIAGGLRVGVVKDHDHVWFNADAGIVASPQSIRENALHLPLPFSGPVVVRVILRRNPSGVLYVDVRDVIPHGGPKLPCVLLGPRRGEPAVSVENRVGGVEDPLHAGAVLQHFQRMGGAHAAVIHAVLVDRCEAGVREHLHDLAHPLEDDGRRDRVRVLRLETHDANKFCAQPLHAWDGAAHFGNRDLEGGLDGFRPVHDRGAKAINVQAVLLKLGTGEIESGIGDIMEVGFRKARHFHAPHFDVFPAQFLCGPYL